ncbi:sulfite exporter TauE/SafE family protein [Candidatus Rhodobacter oscarellae]|uniref:sulfite exporter TauE/SafE family protein n=1 Tax=Candidatus Rhodobacter oscarellae TaxID=1675527 RepID=UPI000ADC24CD|nr:sulfite exporter TauE/SafE family protein [Candidatus Rhodobacter lobularis]
MIAEAWATEGLGLLALGVALAGLVRGFSGFGTAMIYLPIAGQVLPPVWVLITMLVFDFFGPLPAAPRAWAAAHRADLGRLALGALIAMPLGVLVLTQLSPDVFRYVVSVLALGLLAILISGFRWRGSVGPPMVFGTGGVAGFLAGAAGLPGPPVILFYMARPLPPEVIRANVLLFLWLSDLSLLLIFWLRGFLVPEPLVIGALLLPLYIVGILVGTAIFDPAREVVYRRVAYAIIAASALSGLPFWG